jgi:hypothetical protein
MSNIQEIYKQFAKANDLPLEADMKTMQTIIKVLNSNGVDHDFFFPCENCGYLNPNRGDQKYLSDQEEFEDQYPCGNCGTYIFPNP